MQVYLPIAEMPVDPFVVLAMGGAVGFLSGMFGVGGGFLITPLLIFYGIPPAIAVGTQGAQLVASSVSGLTAHLKRKTVDFEMGRFLVIGGGFGSLAGVGLFGYLNARGQIDLYIALAYVIFLGIVGALMFAESARAILRDPARSFQDLKQAIVDAMDIKPERHYFYDEDYAQPVRLMNMTGG